MKKYASAPESTSHAQIEARYGHFIGNKFIKPSEGRYFATANPATNAALSEVAVAGKADVNKAVQSARKASKAWQELAGAERAKYIFRIARMIQERSRELSVIESLDAGKPIRESRDFDIPLAAAHFFYHAGWSDKLQYAFPGRKASAVGVCAQIIPWNFPLLMAAWKIAPAIATGNTVVLKPAETTPLTALKLAEIIRDCDLPPGVVNVITGDGETGRMLASHKDVNKVAFTGSTAVGKELQGMLAGTGKRLTLELGGKSAHIVFADAAINQAVEGVINGIFTNQGEVCCAGSRLFVEESVSEIFIQKLIKRMQTLVVGDPLDKNTDIGAINSKAQLEKIRAFVREAKEDGMHVIESGCELPSRGLFCRPAIITGAGQSSRLMREEVFGPVLAVQTFRTIDEVIAKANNIPYGLSAGVWTEKTGRIFHLTSALRAGVIWANTYNKFDASSPFGGMKESGFGREGGVHGLLPYVKLS